MKRYTTLLLSRWWLIVLLVVLAGGAALAVSLHTTPVYEATATLMSNQGSGTGGMNTDYTSLLASEQLANTYAQMLHSGTVLDKVVQSLGLHEDSDALAKSMTVSVVRDTQLIQVTVDDTNPARAATIANEVVKQFRVQNEAIQSGRYSTIEQTLSKELSVVQDDMAHTQSSLDALTNATSQAQLAERDHLMTLLTQQRSSYTTLLNSLEQARLAEAQTTNNVVVIQDARAADTPVRPRTTLNTALAVFVGLVLAIGAIVLMDYFDDTVKSSEEVEHLVGAATLGVIARMRGKEQSDRLVTVNHTRSPIAEAYRVLRANIEFAAVDKAVRALVVTSAGPGEGKTTTSANLAVVLAQAGKRVILVDADLRKPMLHKYFNQTNMRGLTTALLRGGAVTDHLVASGVPNLALMPSGPIPPNPAEMLGSQRMKELIKDLRGQADVVIFDSPPLLPVVDASLVASACDASLLVVQSGSTRIGGLKKSKEQLLQSGTRLLGVVLNRLPGSQAGYYYYYEYSSNDDNGNGGGSGSGRKQDSKRRWSLPNLSDTKRSQAPLSAVQMVERGPSGS